MSTSIRIAEVDPSSLMVTSDMTGYLVAGGDISMSISDQVYSSGHLTLAMPRDSHIPVALRVYADDVVLGTFFTTPTAIRRGGRLMTAELQLSSMLLALISTRLTTTYAITPAMTTSDVIRAMCRLAGRSHAIDDGVGIARYSEVVLRDAGSDCMSVAQDAATKAGTRLSTDRIGTVISQPLVISGSGQTWTTTPGETDIISEIEKSYAWATSPTRVIASYTNSDVSMSVVASADGLYRGRHIDAAVSVTDLPAVSWDVLRATARRELSDQRAQDVWKFTSLFRPTLKAGAPATVRDTIADEKISGMVTDMTISLSPGLPTEVTIRGEVS